MSDAKQRDAARAEVENLRENCDLAVKQRNIAQDAATKYRAEVERLETELFKMGASILGLKDNLALSRAENERLRGALLQSRWCETTGLPLDGEPQCDVCSQCAVARAAFGKEG